MKLLRNLCQWTLLIVVSSLMLACGGGGGSSGSSSGSSGSSSGSSTSSTATTTLVLTLLDSSNASTNTINSASPTTAQAVLKDGSGNPIANEIVTFTFDTTKIKTSGAIQVLTNAYGSATISLTPASVLAAGAGTIQASAVVSATTYSASKNYQIGSTNVALSNLVGSGAMAAYGTKLVSVDVYINGSTATAAANPIQITFAATCGTMSPAVVTSDSVGSAKTTYTADGTSGCGGKSVGISASSSGANTLNNTVVVNAAAATNLQFISASPNQIYLAGSVGVSQSVVTFKVVDSAGAAVNAADVYLWLDNTSTGVHIDTATNSGTVTKTTNSDGQVSVAVYSGTVPTSVQVNARLVSDASVKTSSNLLKINSGRPAQSRLSLAINSVSIAGYSHDGETTGVVLSMSDRQGNPVPDGTVVNFVSSHGLMTPASCTTSGGLSYCSVNIRSQGTRPSDGFVTILAYAAGEEDFVDNNANNYYDTGDTYTDLGDAYRDDNNNGVYDAGEFCVPRNGVTCNTSGNGSWGSVDVRKQIRMVWATDVIVATDISTSKSAGAQISVSDSLGNSIPTGSTIAVETVGTVPDGCSVSTLNPAVIPNTTSPTLVDVTFTSSCAAGNQFKLTVTSTKTTLQHLFILTP